jgi:hypothetical protein
VCVCVCVCVLCLKKGKDLFLSLKNYLSQKLTERPTEFIYSDTQNMVGCANNPNNPKAIENMSYKEWEGKEQEAESARRRARKRVRTWVRTELAVKKPKDEKDDKKGM